MLSQNISRGFASWKRVKEVLHTEPQLQDGSFDGQTEQHGKIEFRNVSFSYPGSDRMVLKKHQPDHSARGDGGHYGRDRLRKNLPLST